MLLTYEDMFSPWGHTGGRRRRRVEEEADGCLREHLSPLFQLGRWLLSLYLWASGLTVHRSLSQGDLDPSAGLRLLSSVRAPGMGGHEMIAGDAWDKGRRSRQKGVWMQALLLRSHLNPCHTKYPLCSPCVNVSSEAG